ncbi:hypothetical protein PAHAL_2G462100 [Panicum hallii]|uniref:Uncharacterized protein n=1 Tax=Panicum hallii TaxID=206008 RepID=A0A2T8KT31_9POAL|nr:hypothetical protein PAHAL_2G462100 [Panicum hallii]
MIRPVRIHSLKSMSQATMTSRRNFWNPWLNLSSKIAIAGGREKEKRFQSCI